MEAMKVKIFTGGSEEVEKQVNAFIEGKKIIDIKFSYSTTADEDYDSDEPALELYENVAVLIMYE